MKRNKNLENETMKRAKNDEEPNDPAWDIIIPKMNFESQMKIRQLNHRLAAVVEQNADYELQKYRRHIQENKYM